jgi:hypothetical protein
LYAVLTRGTVVATVLLREQATDKGGKMRYPFRRKQLASRINKMVVAAEHAHPDMSEAAAQVYVGDVYSLREQRSPSDSDGWKNRHYAPEPSADSGL